jgi:pimeloyl-ACP methyl ester carboxylesterase
MVEDVSIRSIQQAREAYLTTHLRDKLSKYHQHVDTAFWQWNDVWLSDEFADFDIREICQEIECPVLAIQGREDAYGTLAQIEEIRPRGRIERVVLEECGHAPFKEKDREILGLISDFSINVQ